MPAVLLVHSDERIRDVLGGALRDRDFQVTVVSRLAAAIEAAGHAPPFVMLVDPELIGTAEDSLQGELDRRAGRHVQIVALTSSPTAAQADAAVRLGASLL